MFRRGGEPSPSRTRNLRLARAVVMWPGWP